MNKEYIKEVYKNKEEGIEIKIDLDYESVWLNQDDLSKLYKIERSWIGRLIKQNIQLSDRCCANLAQHLPDGRVFQKKHYSLEVIEKVGYKINVDVTKEFINWSNNLLNELRNENAKKWLPIEVFEDGDVRLEVSISPSENTVWLTQNQIAELFNCTISNVSMHIKKILQLELDEASVVKKYLITASDGKIYSTNYYNLDVIILVGYKINSKRGILFRKWANKIIKQYLIKGFAIDTNRVISYKDNYNDLMSSVININNELSDVKVTLNNHENRLDKIENKEEYLKDYMFFNGEFYNAHSKIIEIIKEARSKIVLIDNYVGKETLDILSYKNNNVKITIITNKEYLESSLNEITINKFNKQYGKLNIIFNNTFHDRFLIIDNIKLYHIGASLKDIGKKCFAISELNNDILELIITKIS